MVGTFAFVTFAIIISFLILQAIEGITDLKVKLDEGIGTVEVSMNNYCDI